MASLAEFRKQYPQYDNVSDQQLADSLHQKFYSNMPKTKFYGEIGFSAKAAPAAPPAAPAENKEELKRGFFRGLINPDMAKKAVQNIKQAGIDYLLTGQNVSDLEQYAAERGGMPVGESEQENVRAVNEAQAPKRAEASKKNLEERAKTQERIEAQTPQYENPLARGAYAGLQSLAQNAPAMAVGIATRNPVVPLASIGAQTGLEQYSNVRQRGGSAHEAALSGLLTGGVEVGTELLPMGTIVKKFGKTGARKFVMELLAKEIPGEIAATMAQDAIDVAIANPDATWSDYWKSRPEAVSQTIIATIAQAGAMGALSKGVSVAKEKLTDAALKGVEAREARLLRQEVVEANKDQISEAFNTIVSDYMRRGVPERDAVLQAGIEINDPDRLRELTDVSVEPSDARGLEPSVPSAGGETGAAVDTSAVADTGPAGLGTPSEPAAGPDLREGQVNAPLVPEMGAPAPTELTATDILHTIEKPAQRRVAAQGMVLGIVQQLAPEADTAMEYTGITADDIRLAATKLVNRGNKFNTPADALLSVIAKKPDITPDALQTLHTLAAPPLFRQEAMPTPAPAPAPVELATPPAPVELTTPPAPVELATPPAPVELATPPAPVELATPPAPAPAGIPIPRTEFKDLAVEEGNKRGHNGPFFKLGAIEVYNGNEKAGTTMGPSVSKTVKDSYLAGIEWAKGLQTELFKAPTSVEVPEPAFTPKEIADNLPHFSLQAAADAQLDKFMFRMGVEELEAERAAALEGETHEPVPQKFLRSKTIPEVEAYYAGIQWARDRIAEAEAPEAELGGGVETPEAEPISNLVQEHDDKYYAAIDQVSAAVHAGDIRRMAPQMGKADLINEKQEKAVSDAIKSTQDPAQRFDLGRNALLYALYTEHVQRRPASTDMPTIVEAEPTYTPQQIVENLIKLAPKAAKDAGYVPTMFREGVREVHLSLTPISKVELERTYTPAEVESYQAGAQWARDRIDEASTPVVPDYIPAGERVKVKAVGASQGSNAQALRNVLAAAPGQSGAQVVFDLAQAELEATPAKELEEGADLTPYDSAYETIKSNPGMNTKRMAKMFGPQLYGDPTNMGIVCIKEVLQNSFDATRSAIDRGLITDGTIDIHISEDRRTLTFKDNGIGMAPELLGGKFLQIAGTDKEGDKNAGGFGIAKMLFLYANKAIHVITARDGRVSELITTGVQLHDALENANDAPDIEVRNFEPADSANFPEGHGTIIRLTIPEEDGDYVIKPLPDYPTDAPLRRSPLFANIKVTFSSDNDSLSPRTVPTGSSFPVEDYTQFVGVKFPWGSAKVYVTKEPSTGASYAQNMFILSNGLWQFQTKVALDPSTSDGKAVPYTFYVDIVPTVKPDEVGYPFSFNRQRFTEQATQDFLKVKQYIDAIYAYKSMADDATSFGEIRYIHGMTGEFGPTIDITPDIPIQNTAFNAFGPEDKVTVKNGELFVNGKKMPDLTPDQLKAGIPTVSKLVVDPSIINTNEVMVHDNLEVVITSYSYDEDAYGEEKVERIPLFDYMNQKFGEDFKDYLRHVGETFMQLRDAVAEFPGYKSLLDEAIGISLDSEYRGMSIRVPFSASFINPLIPESVSLSDPLEAGYGMIGTMIHELAHFRMRNHNADFATEMQRLTYKLKASNPTFYTSLNDDFAELVASEYFGILREAKELFDGNVPNTRLEHRGSSFKDGSNEQAPKTVRNGATEGASEDSGTGSTGESLLSPAYQRIGKSGKGTGPGPSPAPSPAAKQRAKRVTVLEKKIAASHKATELNNSAAQLLVESRSLKDAIRVLNSTWDALTVGSIRKVLVAMDTGDITRWMGDKVANIAVINLGIEDMGIMRNGLIRELAEKVPEWEQFNSTFDEGGRLLGDVMNKTTLKNVDPTLYDTAAESIRNDAVIKGLRAQNKRQSDITQRENEIKDVYRDWDKLGTFGKNKTGQKIYAMAKDSYEQTFNMHMDILTKKILASKIPGDPNDPNTSKGRLMASITKSFQEAQQVGVYFPLMRYGKYWVRIGKGTRGEFYMFESATARNNFVKQRIEEQQAAGDTRTLAKLIEGGDFDVGDTLSEMRTRGGLEKASEMLKDIFDMIDASNLSDIEAVKDQVYQMYLMTLPDKDIRRRFTHRQGKTGFGSDVLRNFIVSQHTAANQLSRLTYADTIRNAIGQAYAETMGDPDKLKLNAVIDEVAIRATTELNPQMTDDNVIDWDKLASMANKVVFFFMLTSPKSALVQMTQLHIVGLPVLAARYGATKVAAVAAKHSNLFNTMGLTRRKANGEIITKWGQPSMADGKYIREHKNPTMRDALKYAWNYGNDRNVFMNTYAGDMSERSGAPTAKRATPLGKSTRFVYNFITGGFHHMERISREIMFMSSFELEYERQRKNKVPHDIAKEAASKEAMRLTYEALFNFSDYNKPRLLKGKGLARVPVQFMAFPMQFASMLIRNFYQALPLLNKAGKREAATKFMGIMGMTAMYGGLTALPMYSAMMGLMDGIRELMRPIMDGEDDDPWYDDDDDGTPLGKRSTDRWFRESYLPTYFGPNSNLANSLGLDEEQALKLQRAIEMGFISSYTGLNIGTSTSLDSLFFRGDTSSKDPEEAVEKFLYAAAFGPTGGLISSMARGVGKIMNGEGAKGVELMLPAFLRGPAAAMRLTEEGNLTTQGAAVKDAQFYTFGVAAGKALAFENTEVAELQKANMLTKDMIEKVLAEKRSVLTRLDQAMQRFDRNPTEANNAAVDKAYDAIEKYNYKNGFYPAFTLEPDDIYNSLTTRQEGRERAVNGLTTEENLTPLVLDLTQKGRRQE